MMATPYSAPVEGAEGFAQLASDFLDDASNAGGSVPRAAITNDALVGIGYALLALREQVAEVQPQRRWWPRSRGLTTAPATGPAAAGPLADPEVRAIVLDALDVAADELRDRAANCGDCSGRPVELCGTCGSRLSRAEGWDEVAETLRGQR